MTSLRFHEGFFKTLRDVLSSLIVFLKSDINFHCSHDTYKILCSREEAATAIAIFSLFMMLSLCIVP